MPAKKTRRKTKVSYTKTSKKSGIKPVQTKQGMHDPVTAREVMDTADSIKRMRASAAARPKKPKPPKPPRRKRRAPAMGGGAKYR